MRLGVDFSHWGGPLSPETAQCWKAQGVSVAIVQYSESMRQHLDALEAAGGFDIEAYVYLYWNRSPWNQTPADRTRAALHMARRPDGSYRIRRLWLDAEDQGQPYREAQLRECVAVCEAAGMPTGIYTGRWWWVPSTGNSEAFKHLPLWHAGYLSNAAQTDLSIRPDFDRFDAYGGWTRPLIWQVQGTSSLCGHSVDLNVMDEEGAPVPEPPAEDPMDERKELELTLLIQSHRLIRALANGQLVAVPGPTPRTVELHRVIDGRGEPFTPPLVVPVEPPE